jgi:hypothetical protein
LRKEEGIEDNVRKRDRFPFAGYVYTEHTTAFGKNAIPSLHRIVKITEQRIYVDGSGSVPEGWHGYGINFIFVLDRQQLERDGRAWSHSQGRYYYAIPASNRTYMEEETDDENVPAFVEILGLSIPFDIQDVKNAYRQKVKTVHPDTGGSVEAFIVLQENYEKALAFFGSV